MKIGSLKKLKKKRWIVLIGIAAFLLMALAAGWYISFPMGNASSRVVRHIPLPVAVVDGQMVTTRELISDTEALRTFYQSQDFASAGMRVDFETDEGKMRLKIKEKDVLDKLVEDQIVLGIAHKQGIDLDRQEAEREINRKISEAGNRRALENNLQHLYGWDIDQFRDKVVMSQLYLQKLSEKYYEENRTNQPQYREIEKAKVELKKDGSNFSEVAKQYSDGESAQSGGELGWFTREQLVPEVAQVVFETKPGTVTEIIQSALGYHIVYVGEFRTQDENSPDDDDVSDNQGERVQEVNIKQIFIRGGGFLDWLKQEKKKSKVTVLMRDYRWDNDKARIVFRDEGMNKAEQRIRAKSEGDPSMW